MSRITSRLLALAVGLGLPAAAMAQGLGWDSWWSEDSEGTSTARAGASWQARREAPDRWWGLNAERARYRGEGWDVGENRLFLRGAGHLGGWRWSGRLGGNGETWLGEGTLYREGPSRTEFFLERDRLDTRRGALEGRYQTFLGLAQDWPVGDRLTFTGVAGWQDFTGGNQRRHLRGTASLVLSETQGISTQLRTRWFADSAPERADYFAPGEYAEALATLVWSRRLHGLRARVVLGAGQRKVQGGGREPARLAEGLLETPAWKEGLRFRLRLGYTDAPQAAAGGPDYRFRYAAFEGSLPL
ncbi:hypothetical protein [Silanimonas lenta]|uniref:hypothetical protein n=1 Tax=Silanimonas lenta TaxID=265429 RepID=UPI0003F5BA3A|nr:hypothetical protein [Silanimonas lenta]